MAKKSKGTSAPRSSASGGLWRSILCCISPREENSTGNSFQTQSTLRADVEVAPLVHPQNDRRKSSTEQQPSRHPSSDSETTKLIASSQPSNALNIAPKPAETVEPLLLTNSGQAANADIAVSDVTLTQAGDAPREDLMPHSQLNADASPQKTSPSSSSESYPENPEASAQNQVITQVAPPVVVTTSSDNTVPLSTPAHVVPAESSSDSDGNRQSQLRTEQTEPFHGEHAAQIEMMRTVGINYSPYPPASLLQPPNEEHLHRKCLVMDLDETLVHSSFKQITEPDFIVPIEIDDRIHEVYVKKRPHVDEFLNTMSELFECVLFTASLAKYADPVSDYLDPTGKIFGNRRLVREHCVHHNGSYIKDIGRIGRPLPTTLLLDNCNLSYMFQPDNGVPITSWFDDMEDQELLELIPSLRSIASAVNVYDGVKEIGGTQNFPYYQKRPDMWQQAVNQGIYNQQFHYYGYGMHQAYNAYSPPVAQNAMVYPSQDSEEENSAQYHVPGPGGAQGEASPDSGFTASSGLAGIITQVDSTGQQVVPNEHDGSDATS